MKVFFNYSIDCELPPEGIFGGPESMDYGEKSVRSFVEAMNELGVLNGASLFVYPDVALKQKKLFKEMAEAGVEVALHLNGLRYSKASKPAWMGSMTYEEQLELYKMAKADIEDVMGKSCTGYRACYASTNHFTFPALEEAGFEWTSTSAAGNYWPEKHVRWAGGWRFPYHPSRVNKLIPGDMRLYEMPIQRSVYSFFNNDPNRFLDVRAETPPDIAGPIGSMLRQVLVENLAEMERVDQPVRMLMGASHNTNPFWDPDSYQRHNLVWVCQYAREIVRESGGDFLPASFTRIKDEADEIGAF